MARRSRRRHGRRAAGITLLEVLAVTVVLGVVALVVLSRWGGGSFEARLSACHTYRGDIELQVERWFHDFGSWPALNLGDIGRNPLYFPDGVPTCPVDGTPYLLDPVTHRVVGHEHPDP